MPEQLKVLDSLDREHDPGSKNDRPVPGRISVEMTFTEVVR
jgi:hypothetical protein